LSAAGRQALASEPGNLDAIATGGDDYEILAAIPPDKADAFVALATSEAVAVTDIGEIVSGKEPPLVIGPDGGVLTFARPSFSHF
jgi:thiamine-monophosphate kinase